MFKFIIIPICSILLSCSTIPSGPSEAQAQPLLSSVNATVNETQSQQEQVIESILKNTGAIWAAADQLPKDHVSLPMIRRSTQLLQEQPSILKSSISNLNEIKVHIDKLTGIIIEADGKLGKAKEDLLAAQEQLKECQEEAASATQRMLRMLLVLCVAGLGLSVPLFLFVNRSLGSIVGVSSLAVLIVANTVIQYIDYLAIGGLILMALAGVFAIYLFYKRQVALKEVVETAEILKKNIDINDKEKIFGDNGVANVIQSPETIKIVKDIRKVNKPPTQKVELNEKPKSKSRSGSRSSAKVVRKSKKIIK